MNEILLNRFLFQSYSGLKSTFPSDGPIVSCLASSEYSNNLMVTSTAPPDPPKLKLASISPEGIEITWQFPQQYGDAVVSVLVYKLLYL